MAIGQPFGHMRYILPPVHPADAAITLFLTTRADADAFGCELVEMDPWARLGSEPQHMAGFLAVSSPEKRCYSIRYGGERAGVIVVRFPWLSGPYLNLLAILAPYRGKGLGRAALAWMENGAREAGARNCWLCVSAFNAPAIAFYERCGYSQAALLDDLIKDGEDELLMRKRIA